MYLELSRPSGDTSRWEKVLKRLTLLNKHYPMTSSLCSKIDFQRKMDNDLSSLDTNNVYDIIKTTLISQDVVFFGGYAISLYSQYMPKKLKHNFEKMPDFDVIAEEPLITSQIIKERLNDNGIKNVKIVQRPKVGEVISSHYEILVGKDTIAFIYKPLACHSYNIIKEDNFKIKIATIDTMLSFWLAFLYANRPYYDKDRILCMAKYLFDVQDKNRLAQKGLLRRFSINCLGHQETVEEMRAEKANKYNELKNKKNTSEYEEWFLRYRPTDDKNINNEKIDKQHKKTKRKMNKKRKTKKNKGIFF